MGGIWPTLLAVLMYLGSFLGLTPQEPAAKGAAPLPPAGGASVSSPAPVNYPGATEVMAFYAERSAGDSTPYLALAKAANKLTTVIPFSYTLDGNGRLRGQANAKMLALARANGLKVLALIHNGSGSNFDAGAAHALLNNSLSRQRALDSIYTLLSQAGFDGVNLDFELVPASDRWSLTSFIRDLAARLRPRHFLVTASLPAKSSDDQSSSWSGAFDYQALAPYLDQVILMTYDEHVAGGTPGPVASYAWVDAVLRYAMRCFPRYKIILGLPAYGYDWSARGDRALSFPQAASLLRHNGLSPSWDYRAQVPYFQYKKAGITHQVWYENNRSAAWKTGLVKQYGLRGVAVWRLGYEDPALWPVLAAQLGG